MGAITAPFSFLQHEEAIECTASQILDDEEKWEELVERLAEMPQAMAAIREIYEYVRHRPGAEVSTSEETLAECLDEVAYKMADDEVTGSR